jgi:hypothetical protein
MFRKISIVVILAAMCVSLAAAGPQQPPAGAGAGGRGGGGGQRGGGGGGRGGGTPTTTMVKPGLFMISGIGGAASVLVRVTDDGLVVANTGVLGDQNIQQLMDQIKMISDKPIKYAVVGDVHQDKSGGTGAFIKAGAQVIGHVNEKEGLKTYTNAAGTPEAPNVTFDKDYSIKLGNKEVARVYAQGGSMIEWPKTLDAVMKLDIDTVIPNRGNPATKADLQAARDRVAKIDSIAIDLVKKGTPKDQLLAQINAADSTLNVNGFLNINAQMRLDAFYEELQKAAK